MRGRSGTSKTRRVTGSSTTTTARRKNKRVVMEGRRAAPSQKQMPSCNPDEEQLYNRTLSTRSGNVYVHGLPITLSHDMSSNTKLCHSWAKEGIGI